MVTTRTRSSQLISAFNEDPKVEIQSTFIMFLFVISYI